ncbi:hypothetical protein HGRIS_006277 [Hohenbuehelia grisea]|uniref:Uncharacterized protein n=1 Tax=Hohenbuehelia grisea TaxID=104357 RepID=A0ABR3K0K9_9AGAR
MQVHGMTCYLRMTIYRQRLGVHLRPSFCCDFASHPNPVVSDRSMLECQYTLFDSQDNIDVVFASRSLDSTLVAANQVLYFSAAYNHRLAPCSTPALKICRREPPATKGTRARPFFDQSWVLLLLARSPFELGS